MLRALQRDLARGAGPDGAFWCRLESLDPVSVGRLRRLVDAVDAADAGHQSEGKRRGANGDSVPLSPVSVCARLPWHSYGDELGGKGSGELLGGCGRRLEADAVARKVAGSRS